MKRSGLLVLLAAAAGQIVSAERQAAQQIFRTSTRTVAIYATVTDRSARLVPNLTQSDFEILDNGRLVPSATFSTSLQPLTLLLMFDTSASLAQNMDQIRLAANACIGALDRDDRARVGTFGHEIAISPHLTADKSILLRVVREELWPGLKTRLWDGLKLALGQLRRETGRRALIVLSDGRDSSTIDGTTQAASRSAVRAMATADDWTVYVVNVGTTIDRSLVEIVEDTGGRAVRVARAAGLAAAYAGVMDELRHQYLLGFVTESADGLVHTIEVRSLRPGLTIRARRTYQADGDRR